MEDEPQVSVTNQPTEEDSNRQVNGDLPFDFEALTLAKVLKVEKKSYVTNLAWNGCSAAPLTAASLSTHQVNVYGSEALDLVSSFEPGRHVTGVCFHPTNPNQLWACCKEGHLSLWDLRTSLELPALDLSDSSDGEIKPLLSFDVNESGTVACAGTELVFEDAFLLFWDVRNTKLLGGYWESHTDDVTCVSIRRYLYLYVFRYNELEAVPVNYITVRKVMFHPTAKDLLATGSTDGLVNVFNISHSSEDDALQTTLNTRSSVDRIQWIPTPKQNQRLACITHTHDLQVWDADEGTLTTAFTTTFVKEDASLKKCVDYWVGALPQNEDSDPVAICGDQGGCIFGVSLSNQGFRFRCQLEGGHTDVVRCCLQQTKNNMFLTGGEDGTICQWTRLSR